MKYVDLFAGCGGLSLGLERAGFELVVAVEKSEMAAETFYHNFVKRIGQEGEWRKYRETSIENQFDNKVVTKEVGELLANDKLMKRLKAVEVDIVVGGPPCQGFSLAGRRNSDDIRNKLPWQYLEFVEKINPKAVVIENVVGISRNFKNGEPAPFDQLQEALREIGEGYIVQAVHVNAMHFGVPEHRPRLMILGLRKDIADKMDIKSTNSLWYSNFSDLVSDIPSLAPVPTIKESYVRTVVDAISDLSEVKPKNPSHTSKNFVKEMGDAELWGLKPLTSGAIPNQTPRKHQDKAVSRFRLYQYLRVEGLASKILNIPTQYGVAEAQEALRALYKDVTMPAHAPDGTLLADTIEDLIDLTFELKTKKHSQRSLHWNKPSPTVVTLPDDYIHPSEPRIFTVRELARFQSFPDAFEFRAKETTGGINRRNEVPQYSQVGNAVAPLLALAVGRRFYEILSVDEKTDTR